MTDHLSASVAAPIFDLQGKRVFVAGHKGMAGSAIVRRLASEGCDVLTADRHTLDLTRQEPTERWFEDARPDVVFLAAARVGGIKANDSFPVSFLEENIAIARTSFAVRIGPACASFSSSAHRAFIPGTPRSRWPRTHYSPGRSSQRTSGMPLPRSAGIKLCQAYRRQYGDDFISVMPTNLYGPGDNYHPEHSHVPAALIRRMHEAKMSGAPTVTIWGTGTPRREFLAVDDLADACVFVMKHYSRRRVPQHRHGRGPDDCRLRAARGRRGRLPRASWSSTHRSPTARRASCSMCHALLDWAGRLGPSCVRALLQLTKIF